MDIGDIRPGLLRGVSRVDEIETVLDLKDISWVEVMIIFVFSIASMSIYY